MDIVPICFPSTYIALLHENSWQFWGGIWASQCFQVSAQLILSSYAAKPFVRRRIPVVMFYS